MTDLLTSSGASVPTATAAAARETAEEGSGRNLSALRPLWTVAKSIISVLVIFVVWQLLVKGASLDPFSTRGPGDVWRFLTGSDAANDLRRHEVFAATGTTVRDAAIGLSGGTIAGLALALVFNRWRAVEQSLMPIAMSFRAVPLVAMTPLIVIIFGRDLGAVAVISGIITFFPTLINVGLALRAVPAPSIDLMRAYGASKGKTLWKVQLPSALPALFASIRIAAPLALVGALLAEWLATGDGLGSIMLLSAPASEYDKLWSAAAISTLMGVVLYGLVSAVEQGVLSRFSDPAR